MYCFIVKCIIKIAIRPTISQTDVARPVTCMWSSCGRYKLCKMSSVNKNIYPNPTLLSMVIMYLHHQTVCDIIFRETTSISSVSQVTQGDYIIEPTVAQAIPAYGHVVAQGGASTPLR